MRDLISIDHSLVCVALKMSKHKTLVSKAAGNLLPGRVKSPTGRAGRRIKENKYVFYKR